MIGDERRVVEAFASWLREQGWTVTAEVQFVDLYAERHGERRFVEAKGRTTAPGLDVDTMYGQLLRRVTEESPSVRYYVVVPSSAVRAALRVPRWVRDRLAIDVYGVSRRRRGEWSARRIATECPAVGRQPEHTVVMLDEAALWERIRRHAGAHFQTKTGAPYTYRVPGNYLRVNREGKEINRSLSRTNFVKAAAMMPTDGPGSLKDRQGAAYTWAILMDERIRGSDW